MKINRLLRLRVHDVAGFYSLDFGLGVPTLHASYFVNLFSVDMSSHTKIPNKQVFQYQPTYQSPIKSLEELGRQKPTVYKTSGQQF
jgi:hypothetical protein